MKHLVLVFGVFDVLHEGHRAFIKQARKFGPIAAVVARDRMVKRMKGRMPQHTERTRLKIVRKLPGITKALLGDRTMGAYTVIRKVHPTVICLGYDQRALEKDLRNRMRRKELPSIRIVRLKAHKPGQYKSSKSIDRKGKKG